MNDDQPSDSPPPAREQLEMRLTMLLMGELPANEAAALEAQMATDPALATLYGRLRKATELLREASALPEPAIVSPEPLRLSNERREKLLAHFKTGGNASAGSTDSPAPVIPLRKKRDWTWVPMSLAAALVVFVGLHITGVQRTMVIEETPDFAGDAGAIPPLDRTSEPINAFGVADRPATARTVTLTPVPGSPEQRTVANREARERAIKDVEFHWQRPIRRFNASEEVVVTDTSRTRSAGEISSRSDAQAQGGAFDGRMAAAAQTGDSSIKLDGVTIQGQAGPSSVPQVPNPIVGRQAFWSDSETSKSDIDTKDSGTVTKSGSGTFSGTLAGTAGTQVPVLGDIPILGNVQAQTGGGNTSVGQLTINGGVSLTLSGTNTYTGGTSVNGGNLEGFVLPNGSNLAEAPKSLMERNAPLDQKPTASDFDTGMASLAPAKPGVAGPEVAKAKNDRLYPSTDELFLREGEKLAAAPAPAMEPAAASDKAAAPGITVDSSTIAAAPLTANSSRGSTAMSANAIDALMFGTVPGTNAPAPTAPAAPASAPEPAKRKLAPKPDEMAAMPMAPAPPGKDMEVAKLENVDFKAEKKADTDAPAKAQPAAPPAVPQPEVSTQANPFSTFSLNVSDVGFKLAAASLAQGRMPDPASVRSEEFLNAFNYRDPEPTGGAPLAFASEQARYPFAQNRDLLRLSVKTAAAGREPGRPLNLVLLIDNSGSMERADRVGILREALRTLAGQLQPQDQVSVVTFARTPRLWASGASGDKAKAAMERVLDLPPQGGTNLEAGLTLAYETARKHHGVGSISRVVLITDGAANLGDVNPEALKKMVETQRLQGIALDCFGIGWEGYDDSVMETLSRNGDGRYGFINSPEEAATEFAGQLAGALRVAASDVKVQVEFNPKRVTAYRQIGYAKHQLTKEQFRDNTVDAAEIGAAESGNALYVVEVNPRGEGDLAMVRVRFKVPGTTDYREHAWPVEFVSGNNVPALDVASPSMRLAGTAAAFAEWLVGSPYAQEVTPDRLLGLINGVPVVYWPDPRPRDLETMIRQAKSVSGR